MPLIFISYDSKDSDVALRLAAALRGAGFRTWAYEEDSLPGPSYLEQIVYAILESDVVAIIISRESLRSVHVAKELFKGYESGKALLPILRDLNHAEFKVVSPEWDQALVTNVAIPIPPDGLDAILHRILAGIEAMIRKRANIPKASTNAPTRAREEKKEPEAGDAWAQMESRLSGFDGEIRQMRQRLEQAWAELLRRFAHAGEWRSLALERVKLADEVVREVLDYVIEKEEFTSTKGQTNNKEKPCLLGRKLLGFRAFDPPAMRKSRLKAPPHHPLAYYHCVSRVVNREFVLGPEEKEELVRLMRLYEEFCELRVVTYCIMSNHFHILVEVPKRPEQMPDDGQLLAKLKRAYSPEAFAQLRWQLENLRTLGANEEAEALRESFFRRMWDVSFFMKGLKQRFTGWYNRQRGRKGTLWEERFKSVLVESGQALVTMATYIDLNPVRAGLMEDPKEYRWCGYAAAVAGKRRARSGLKTAMVAWAHGEIGEGASMEKYRELLFGVGEQGRTGSNGQRVKRGISRERVKEVLAKKGKLTRWEMLRCRVRYFCDGAVLGSKEFVNGIFAHERHRFGPKRQTGARPLRHVEADGLTTLRDLRFKPLG